MDRLTRGLQQSVAAALRQEARREKSEDRSQRTEGRRRRDWFTQRRNGAREGAKETQGTEVTKGNGRKIRRGRFGELSGGGRRGFLLAGSVIGSLALAPIVNVALDDFFADARFDRQIGIQKLTDLKPKDVCHFFNGFEPYLLFSSCLKALVKFEAQSAQFRAFLLGDGMSVTQGSKTLRDERYE